MQIISLRIVHLVGGGPTLIQIQKKLFAIQTNGLDQHVVNVV